ncbi:MAG: 2OG-Fe(II) oxygenase [Waddliaceae bacterium]
MKQSYLEVKNLSFDSLQKIFRDEICVLVVRGYASNKVCEKLHNFLVTQKLSEYTHENRDQDKIELIYFGVNRYGFPLNNTYDDETGEKYKTYINSAHGTMNNIRKVASPYLSPIDRLRVEFDEIWPNHSNVAVIDGRKALCGIARIMPPERSHLSADQPHYDLVSLDYFPTLKRQYAANFYLKVPAEGGELEMWDVEPIKVGQVKSFTVPTDWRAELPESFKVKPEQGDLLIFNTCRPHAITSFKSDFPRTSLQTFIGLDQDESVFMWN